MAKSDISQEHMLMCLRLAAECNNLARDAAMPNHARADYIPDDHHVDGVSGFTAAG
jgi:hypothetical protein